MPCSRLLLAHSLHWCHDEHCSVLLTVLRGHSLLALCVCDSGSAAAAAVDEESRKQVEAVCARKPVSMFPVTRPVELSAAAGVEENRSIVQHK